MAYLSLLSGLLISGVAIFYSVSGLTSIFSAAFWPIIIMGSSLEVAKLVATVWLKQNWSLAPKFLKSYLLVAVILLMGITSMGIFGFLSRAHSDQGLVSGDIAAQIAAIDQNLEVEKTNITGFKKDLAQLDDQVNLMLSRTTDAGGTNRSVQIRKQQAAERKQLQNNISESQARIKSLQTERSPIAAQNRKVESEVGPIKYIAAFIYGDNPTENVLEKAVTWVIILIVVVFDPLAIMLLLASQYSFQQIRKIEEELDRIESGEFRLSEHFTEPKVIFPTPPDADPAHDAASEPIEEAIIVSEILPEVAEEFTPTNEPDDQISQIDNDLLDEKLDSQESIFPETQHIEPVPLDIMFPDPEDAGIREFFENGKEVARRLDAGESLEGISGAIIEPTVEYEFIDEEFEPDYVVPENLDAVDISEEDLPASITTSTEHITDIEVTNGNVEEEKLALAGYVQNEEQHEGGLWSKIASGKWNDLSSTPISEPKYLLMSKLRNSDVK